MEKLQYSLCKPADQDSEAFRQNLLAQLEPDRLDGVRGLRIAVADEAVARGQGLRQETLCPAPDALLSAWLDSAIYRESLEAVMTRHCERFHGYLVTESAPLVNEQPAGERMDGWTQVVFLERPAHLTEADWLDIWQGSHTGIAIETQSTFAYRQNLVVRSLTEGAPEVHAIVEESFPNAALDSPHAFYDADSDEALQDRVKTMIDSCARFIDFERITVTPMSDYLLRSI